uniref:CGG triplet repeat-binding protein 1 n=1 Tax=Cyprinus carpio TaxID=7962 RepID=A0A8C2DU57_CYPCA
MCESNVSHLPSKITAIDRQKQYPGILHETGGKLFCTACNIVVEHKRKSSIDKHFATAKHNMRCAEMQAGRQTTRQITMTQAVASRSIASSERIKVSYFKCASVNIPLSKSDHPVLRKFLKEKVVNGGAIPGSHQLQEKYLGDVYLQEKETLKTNLTKRDCLYSVAWP